MLFLSIALLWIACEDKTRKYQAAIVGRWELAKGFRNNKETETLAGTYFQFGEDGNMQTNLPFPGNTGNPIAYEMIKNEIRHKNTPAIKYLVQNLSDSTMILTLEMRGMDFEMHLQRASLQSPVDSTQGESLPDSAKMDSAR